MSILSRLRALPVLSGAALAGISIIHNRILFKDKSWSWICRKSAIDLLLFANLVFLLPFLLIAYSGAYITEHIVVMTWVNRYWVVTVGTAVMVALVAAAALVFELIALFSLLPLNIITGKIWQKYRALQQHQDNLLSNS